MNDHAHVGSSDAIVEFRAALLTFLEESMAAVESIEMKAQQTLRFLDEEAPNYWSNQTRLAYDGVNKTRIELNICRNRTVAGRKSSCIEEKKAFARAQDRLELCRRQQGITRKTSIDAHDAADEFRARISHLHRLLETEVPKLQGLLHRTSVSLDAYTATRPPSAQPFNNPPAENSEDETTSTASASSDNSESTDLPPESINKPNQAETKESPR